MAKVLDQLVDGAAHKLVLGRLDAESTTDLPLEVLERLVLEDLKREIGRTFGVETTKNELVRCAIHHLVEDFRRERGDSIILRRLRKARSR